MNRRNSMMAGKIPSREVSHSEEKHHTRGDLAGH
jgi:hypothetical protein